jgi:peptide deformylase
MAVKEILKIPNILLTAPCKEITVFDAETKQLAQDLIETLDVQQNPAGAGLAAPQLGILKRMCVVRKYIIDKEGKETYKSFILINPKLTSESSSTDIRWEACLSIPKKLGKVKRAKRVSIIASDVEGNTFKLKGDGFFARVIQHEIDHLNGVLYTSKIIGELLSDEEFEKSYAAE